MQKVIFQSFHCKKKAPDGAVIFRCSSDSILRQTLNKNNKKKLVQHFVPITLFAYATKCDLYLDIEFKPFDWVFKKPVATEWYIADERFRKMTEDSVKLNKTISMKFPTKAFTNYKQIELPIEKDTKKDEKK